VFIFIDGKKWLLVWLNPPKIEAKDLPDFCPKEFCEIIVKKFRIHIHQHPAIPFDDATGTYFTATEIYEGAVRDMYQVCFNNDLSQVWVYLWNWWYNPAQWKFWAWSANSAIPHIKTTMIVESLWKHIKHRDLAHFNRPQLDLITHVVIENVLP
jgi:hypothetical protein